MSNLCLVTGANGHLGNNLVRALLKNGYRVRAGVRDLTNTRPFDGLDCEVVFADLLDKRSLLKAMEGVDLLFQVAAVFKHWARNPEKEIIEPNMEGTKNVLEVAAELGVRKVVYVSSIAAVGHGSPPLNEDSWNRDDSNPYYKAKTESEMLAWELADRLGLRLVSVLPSAIIGSNVFGQLTPTMQGLKAVLDNKMPINPNFHFNYVDVRDVAEGIVAAAEKGRIGERYLLANEEVTTSTQLVRTAQSLYPHVRMPPKVPKSVVFVMASLAQCVSGITKKEPALLRSWVRLYHKADLRCDTKKAKTELGFAPRSPEEAMKDAFVHIAGETGAYASSNREAVPGASR